MTFNIGDRVKYVGRMHSMKGWAGVVTEVEPGWRLSGAILLSTIYGVAWDNGDYGPSLRHEDLEQETK